jgi:hypothetical protein
VCWLVPVCVRASLSLSLRVRVYEQGYIDALVLNRGALTRRMADLEADLARDLATADGSSGDRGRTLRPKSHVDGAKERVAARRRELEGLKQFVDMDGSKQAGTPVPRAFAFTHAYTHPYIHTRTHTHTYPHIHTYIRSPAPFCACGQFLMDPSLSLSLSLSVCVLCVGVGLGNRALAAEYARPRNVDLEMELARLHGHVMHKRSDLLTALETAGNEASVVAGRRLRVVLDTLDGLSGRLKESEERNAKKEQPVRDRAGVTLFY